MRSLYLIIILISLLSCKSRQQTLIIKGEYTYNIIDNPNNNKDILPQLKGKILDKKTSEPLQNSAIMITLEDGKSIGTEPDQEGYFELDIPMGEYEIEVISFEKTRIKTKKINFKANKEYDFTFYLGTTIQY